MATEKSAMPTEKAPSENSGSEKAAAEHVDRKGSLLVEEAEPDKNLPAIRKVDYSGAYEKTDPKEIALVKKLDRWIMVRSLQRASKSSDEDELTKSLSQPMLWSMYWLNYLDRNAIALARLNDLEADLNLTGSRK